MNGQIHCVLVRIDDDRLAMNDVGFEMQPVGRALVSSHASSVGIMTDPRREAIFRR